MSKGLRATIPMVFLEMFYVARGRSADCVCTLLNGIVTWASDVAPHFLTFHYTVELVCFYDHMADQKCSNQEEGFCLAPDNRL
jgi:hypothetical protein